MFGKCLVTNTGLFIMEFTSNLQDICQNLKFIKVVRVKMTMQKTRCSFPSDLKCRLPLEIHISSPWGTIFLLSAIFERWDGIFTYERVTAINIFC